MMNIAVSGGNPMMAMQPGAMENVRYMSARDTNSPAAATAQQLLNQPPPPPPPPILSSQGQSGDYVPESFKDHVARRCGERNIWFTPVLNKRVEGKQVYKCGNVNIYLDRKFIFVFRNGRWEPIDLNTLLETAI